MVERSAHNRLVVGSIPTEPRTFDLSNVSVSILEMLEALMGTDGKRKLRLRQKTSDELFALYHSQLVLRYQSQESPEAASRFCEREAAPADVSRLQALLCEFTDLERLPGGCSLRAAE